MEDLKEAIKVLKKGGIVIFPTDTAYGIGCRIDHPKAIKRLFKLRKRPISQAVPVLVDSIEMAQKYLVFPLPHNVRRLMETYWPGALTIVYSCINEKVPSLVRGGGKTLGIRMPNHRLILSLITKVGVPILGPSANFHSQPTPFNYKELDKELIKLVDDVIIGKCLSQNVSTVIDCSVYPWKIIRQGVVKIKDSINLDIDSSDNRKIILSLDVNGERKTAKKITGSWTSQVLLPLIEELLKKNKISLSQLSEIKVNPGPGSYTGVRVGVAIANALGWLLGIPVNGKKGKLVVPVY